MTLDLTKDEARILYAAILKLPIPIGNALHDPAVSAAQKLRAALETEKAKAVDTPPQQIT